LLTAHQIRHRTPFHAPPHQLAEAASGVFGGRFLIARIQLDAPAAQGVGQQHFRVQPRKLRPLLGQVAGGPVEQTADGPGLWLRAHACTLSNRCFLSKSWSAWISSPRLPAMMASSLYRFRLMRWSVTRFCGKL